MNAIDFERLRVLYPDTFGFARGKYVPIGAVNGKLNYSVTAFGIGYDRGLIPAPGAAVLEGMTDMTAVYDPAAARPSWQEKTGIVIADLQAGDQPLAISPRVALQEAVKSLVDIGYMPKIGVEIEGYVLERNSTNQWVPWNTPTSYCYGTGVLADPVGLVDDIMTTAANVGIPIETVSSEYESAQFEFTVHYDDPLVAIDNTFLLKLLARERAIEHGLMMTFLGRPFNDRGGSGIHLNLSLTDSNGVNLFDKPDEAMGISKLTHQAIAGALAHHEGLTAICAPTVNSYKRLFPGQLSGYWANWGHDHRSVAVRVPGDRGTGTRIESRLADGSANPYLAAAALLQACRLGIEGEMVPPPPEEGDGLEVANTERCCPENLSMALDALEADLDLVASLGSPLVRHFVAMKRAEWARFSRTVTDWELNEYLSYH